MLRYVGLIFNISWEKTIFKIIPFPPETFPKSFSQWGKFPRWDPWCRAPALMARVGPYTLGDSLPYRLQDSCTLDLMDSDKLKCLFLATVRTLLLSIICICDMIKKLLFLMHCLIRKSAFKPDGSPTWKFSPTIQWTFCNDSHAFQVWSTGM